MNWRRAAGVAIVGCLGLVWPAIARAAAPVRGTIVLPRNIKGPGDRFSSFWARIENGILPIAPPLVSAMSEVLVVLEGSTTSAAWAGNLTMEVSGADFSPRVVPVLVGTTVEFKNADRVPYTLFSPENGAFFGKEETPPGKSRRIKFLAPGAFLVRADEFPHMEGAIIVLKSNLSAKPDDKGAFKIDAVPEGHYTLRVFFRGSFVHEQGIDVPQKGPLDITVKLPAPAGRKAE
jgi:plastocyanin